MTQPPGTASKRTVIAATVTPLASILGSGLLIIVPVLESTLGVYAVFGAIGICALAWVVGTVIRHNVMVVEPLRESHTLDPATVKLGSLSDVAIVIAYTISVALYLRIMAQYIVRFFSDSGSAILEPVIACLAVVLIVAIGVRRGFVGLDRLDRVSLAAVLVLTVVLGAVVLSYDLGSLSDNSLRLPPVPAMDPIGVLLVLGGIVITTQGFETVAYLGDEYDSVTRVRASRLAQLVASAIYIGFVAAATPAMGLGTAGGADSTLLDITGRVAPWLALPLVLSAALSQFSAAIADTSAADGNLRGLSHWFAGSRAYYVSGGVAIVLAATVPTLAIVAIASRAFAAYYAIQAVIAVRTSHGVLRKTGYGALAIIMLAVTLFALPAG